MKKNILPIIVIAMAFMLAACGSEEDNVPFAGQNLTKTELTVWGMTCNSCVNKVTKAVSALDGVASVSVDLRADEVTVEHDSSVDVGAIKESIIAEGYSIE
jgi:copper ion binding protein